jgi:hypothetical protein
MVANPLVIEMQDLQAQIDTVNQQSQGPSRTLDAHSGPTGPSGPSPGSSGPSRTGGPRPMSFGQAARPKKRGM